MTLDEQRARLRQMLDDSVPEHAAAIVDTARPSLRLFTDGDDDSRSHFGGRPELPADTPWPNHDGRPLVFLLQVDLADVAAHGDFGLPDSGLLSFYVAGMWGVEDDAMFHAYGSVGRALFTPGDAETAPRDLPYGGDDDDPFPVSEAGVRFELELSLPPLEGPDFDPLGLEGTDTHAAYWDEVWMERHVFDEEPFHRLLGYPDMNYDTQSEPTRLLLQMDSDLDIDWELGDFQPIRFLLSPEAFAKGDFGSAIVDADES